ncbi:ATP-binding protein [Methylovulum psychrotolerans]|uniref:ATP-binding protein n=1 Tax=Methylovulum psychrotolerans TaxID=1704499 RepID=A0A1Z4BUW4_9GAMM|nr:ATP-binding protein [Methylovulum psychrotolerans]ASF45050.1 hypothetical protein CEK71_02640 [Methylovulum psychrotolerans]
MDELNKTVIGKDIIESLTLGMYEDARIIYREYIQNSADQIDKAVKIGSLESITDGNIWIEINKDKRRIVIEDNATGISFQETAEILKNIAQSTKKRGIDKGFRGIGRLGGLAYCEKLIFETSYKGECVKTIVEWDARKLKLIINDRKNKETASEVIDNITEIHQESEQQESHYFKVTLNNVSNPSLLNVIDIRDYLAMVAPTNIHPRFTLLSKIRDYVRTNNIVLDEYKIYVNSDELSKAYTTKIYELSGNEKKTIDEIKDIVFFEKKSDQDGSLLLWGWYGTWSFSKQIPEKANLARGIRLRKSNIQIGDEYCLVKLHREPRGNFYYFGEVHAIHSELIPNARRDYFLENDYLMEFENHLKEYFKKLYGGYHLSSKIRSAQRDISRLAEINRTIKEKEQKGYVSHEEKATLEKERQEQLDKATKAEISLQKYSENSRENEVNERIFNELTKENVALKKTSTSLPVDAQLSKKSENDEPVLKKEKVKIIFIDDNTLPRQNKEERKLIKRVYDVISKNIPDKAMVENIRLKIIDEFNKGK